MLKRSIILAVAFSLAVLSGGNAAQAAHFVSGVVVKNGLPIANAELAVVRIGDHSVPVPASVQFLSADANGTFTLTAGATGERYLVVSRHGDQIAWSVIDASTSSVRLSLARLSAPDLPKTAGCTTYCNCYNLFWGLKWWSCWDTCGWYGWGISYSCPQY